MANLTTRLNKEFSNDVDVIATKDRQLVDMSIKGANKAPKIFMSNQENRLGNAVLNKYIAMHLKTIESKIEEYNDISIINWR